MLSREENELITHTGPGTPMGEVLRRYWMPILLERELAEPDGEPVRVQILGERLVAFRDSDGRIGLLDELCPHRRVSLWLGRNEDCGLRCAYHGWKFDVDGRCVEQMNEPGENSFADKVKITHYPTIEQGGIIWTYMGPPEKQPPPPCFEFTTVPATHRHASKVIEECNWLQALEGGIDTSHAPILHRALRASANRPGIDPRSPFVRGGPPKLEVNMTDYGYRYAGIRQMPEGEHYVRGYHYVMPFTQLRPASMFGNGFDPQIKDSGPGHFWVPMDDHTVMVWNFAYSLAENGISDEERREYGNGNGPDHVDPHTFRAKHNQRDNWGIDRRVQKNETFSGIEGVNAQDRAVQESMGPIVDRSQEYLGPADKAIIAMRRLLLQAIKTVEAGGDPPAADASYWGIRAVERMVPEDQDWREVILPLMYGPVTASKPELATVS
jgi:phenylpropionate dioxygenase-like ring-hydroxylating dioxygenase large terminal subunit